MTIQEARALLNSDNRWVRHCNKNCFRHWGHGLLVDIDGEYAIIRPGKRHRGTEKIHLSMVKPWKSMNGRLPLTTNRK